jgi:hypothetical protein
MLLPIAAATHAASAASAHPVAAITLFEFLRWVPRRIAEWAVRSLPSRKSESSNKHAMDI